MINRRTFIAASVAMVATRVSATDAPKYCVTGYRGNVAGRLIPNLVTDFVGIDKKDGPEFDLANTGPDAKWQKRLEGCQTVIHLAATPGGNDHALLQRNNFLALANLFDECVRQKKDRVIFASSILAEPGKYGMPGEDDLPAGDDRAPGLYGWGKRYAESLGKSLASSQTSFVGVRFGVVPSIANEARDMAAVDDWTRSVRTTDDNLHDAFWAAQNMILTNGFGLLESFRGTLKPIG